MTTEPAPRWRRLEPDERKEQIFACAARLFSDRPYSEVSTSDIAAEAGVARGLINHYFGTKRELYLEIIRRALTVPRLAVEILPEGPLELRADVAIDWFLDMVTSQEKMWLAAIAPEGIGRDLEVERILEEADRESADRVLEAVGLSRESEHGQELNALVRAFGGMVKAAGREWLVRGSLDRSQVHTLLSKSLVTLVGEVFPEIQRAAPRA
ncbi:TetR/AcrR family transcriptional regulator [Amycolatopsis roodepoortensis]|uniref:TetR/AcrR family transcriptional regulator n=1 Tax=Amycolatopsis roodepoortensis TaxID=700274 RepID=UPI000F88066D|nr:TetR/AcrR family transcriptional regulator [Amycolatopsis roodepoortensis]RSN12265.1 TetR family transcriptional regulator [Streptomyces sp. WAC 05977]UUV34527.1 TetR/AcrR family transcriptional regulator [Amycolatopsis roodepoortensis]